VSLHPSKTTLHQTGVISFFFFQALFYTFLSVDFESFHFPICLQQTLRALGCLCFYVQLCFFLLTKFVPELPCPPINDDKHTISFFLFFEVLRVPFFFFPPPKNVTFKFMNFVTWSTQGEPLSYFSFQLLGFFSLQFSFFFFVCVCWSVFLFQEPPLPRSAHPHELTTHSPCA